MSTNLDYEINKELGECYLFMGELDKAEDYYKKAIGSNGVHADPYLGMATIAVQRGELDKALTLYQKAASIEESDKPLAGMALVEMEIGREEAAFEHMVKALEKNPENMVAIFGLIRLAHTLGRLDTVVPHLENYLQLDPMKNEIRYSLAGCLICLGRNAEAKNHLARILENDPDNAQAKELMSQAA
ncbi:tetratricopeptide repeat protein [Desulfocurvibacter africanus]|uniref:tetratricopeptide repeat protein n=1 Tax=Desulfocurvibacter africanus TaxID=873 RepID=UPI002FD93CEF